MTTWEPHLKVVCLELRHLGAYCLRSPPGVQSWLEDFYPEGIQSIEYPFEASPYPFEASPYPFEAFPYPFEASPFPF